MSMINAAAPYRRDDRQTVRVPVVMPLVEVDVDVNGFLKVALDHEPYSADGSLTRDDLQRILDEIAADLGTAVRVEVHEADGNTFTDIVTPARPRQRMVKPVREVTTTIGDVTGGLKLKVRPKCALSPDFRGRHQHPDLHHRRSEPVFVSNATHSTWCVIGNRSYARIAVSS